MAKKPATSEKATPKKVVAKKETTKKVATKKVATKKEVVKKQISFKSVGRNVILLIDNQKYSKAIPEKAQRDNIQALVEAYNKTNSIKKKQEIIELMLVNKTTEKSRKEEILAETPNSAKKIAEKKEVKEVAKKAPASMSIEEAKKFLEANNYRVSEIAPATKRRSGEH